MTFDVYLGRQPHSYTDERQDGVLLDNTIPECTEGPAMEDAEPESRDVAGCARDIR